MEVLYKDGTNPTRSGTQLVGLRVVTSADVTATSTTVDLSKDLGLIQGAIVTIKRAGAQQAGGTVTFPLNVLTVATGNGYTLTAGDVLNYIVFGSKTN